MGLVCVYLVKPEPREIWVDQYKDGRFGTPRPSKQAARDWVKTYLPETFKQVAIHFREVVDE